MSQIIEVVCVNPLRKGEKNGRPWEMQDASCILFGTDGVPSGVGTIMLPKHLRGEHAPARGKFYASFSLVVGLMDGRINAAIQDLKALDSPKVVVAKAGM